MRALGDARSLADHVADAMRADRPVTAAPAPLARTAPGTIVAVREIMQAKAAPGEGIETYSDEERALVREMVASGYDNKAIQDALDKRRAADPARTRRELMAARQANTP